MSKEAAIRELFELSRAFTGLSIVIVDEETNRVKGEINPNRKKRRK